MTDRTSQTFTLSSGHTIGYAEFGSATGNPIFWFHGWPGSRLCGAHGEDVAKALNARIISMDRPGIGLSSPQPYHKVIDHAKDVEALAEHLGLDEYRAMGTSGGGPTALACAALAPKRLKAVTIVVGLGPPDIGYAGMAFPNRLGWTYAIPYIPGLLPLYFGRQAWAQTHLPDDERLRLVKQELEQSSKLPQDIESLKDPKIAARWTASSKEVLRQGWDGLKFDGKLSSTTKGWGFKVEDIPPSMPLHLWYGKLDTNVPAAHGVEVAKRFKGEAKLHLFEDETHNSTQFKYAREIMKELLEAGRK